MAYLVALFGGCSLVGDFILVLSSGGSVGTFVRVLNIQRGIIDNVPPPKVGSNMIKSAVC